MTANTVLWYTTVLMTAGGLLILFVGRRRTPHEFLATVCHGIVPLIAACSYFAMAAGQGAVSIFPADAVTGAAVGSGRVFYFARYIDWSFTTPILLFTLSMLAMRNGPKLTGAILGVILADVMMIVTAFAFGATEAPAVKWIWFLVSCLAFLGVYYILWIVNMQANASERIDVRQTYRRNAVVLSVLWLAYPVVLAIAPDGLKLIDDASSVLLIAILDVVAKVVYGLMATMSDSTMTERDLADGKGETAAGAFRAVA